MKSFVCSVFCCCWENKWSFFLSFFLSVSAFSDFSLFADPVVWFCWLLFHKRNGSWMAGREGGRQFTFLSSIMVICPCMLRVSSLALSFKRSLTYASVIHLSTYSSSIFIVCLPVNSRHMFRHLMCLNISYLLRFCVSLPMDIRSEYSWVFLSAPFPHQVVACVPHLFWLSICLPLAGCSGYSRNWLSREWVSAPAPLESGLLLF